MRLTLGLAGVALWIWGWQRPLDAWLAWQLCWLGGLGLVSSFGRSRRYLSLAILLVPLLDWQDWGTSSAPQYIPQWTAAALWLSAASGWPQPLEWKHLARRRAAWKRLGFGLLPLAAGLLVQKGFLAYQSSQLAETARRFDWFQGELLFLLLALLMNALWCLAVRCYASPLVLAASGLVLLLTDSCLHFGMAAAVPALLTGYLGLALLLLSSKWRSPLWVAGGLCLGSGLAASSVGQAVAVTIPLFCAWNHADKEGVWYGWLCGLLWLNPVYWLLRLSERLWRWLDGPGWDSQA